MMKSMRESFEENYQAVREPFHNKQGFRICYEYIGPWYQWNLNPASLRMEKRRFGSMCAVSLILFLAGSFQNSVLNYSRYTELFGLLSTAAFIFEIIGTIQFCMTKEKVTNMTFFDIHTKLMAAPLIHGLLLMCMAAACVPVLAARGVSAVDIGVLLCNLGAGGASLVIFVRYSRMTYSVVM